MPMPSLVRVTISENPPARLDKALARDVPEDAALSRSRLARLIAEGAVQRGGEAVTDAKARVMAGEVFEITVPVAEESHIGGEEIALDIVYEDTSLIVVNKPAGMVVHPAPGRQRPFALANSIGGKAQEAELAKLGTVDVVLDVPSPLLPFIAGRVLQRGFTEPAVHTQRSVVPQSARGYRS